MPQAVIADNGTEFRGAVARLLQEESVLYVHGKPYGKTTQGLVERANQTIAKMIEALYRGEGQHRYTI